MIEYLYNRVIVQWWRGWRGRHLRWLLCWRYPTMAMWAVLLLLPLHIQHHQPTLGLWMTAAESAPVSPPVAPVPHDALYPLQVVRTQRAPSGREVRRLKTAARAAIRTGNRKGTRIGWWNTLYTAGGYVEETIASGFRRASRQTYYETTRPTLRTASSSIYVSQSTGVDAPGRGSIGSPYATPEYALANASVGANIYLWGTFLNNSLGMLSGITSEADRVAWLVWPGKTAAVRPRVADAFFNAAYFVQGKPYGWVEGITLDGDEAYQGYCVRVEVDGSTTSHHTVILDCPITGSFQTVTPADLWLEGGTIDSAGANGLISGPTTACTATLSGTAGNVTVGAHSIAVQYVVTNSPSALGWGTTEYSLTGASSTDATIRATITVAGASNAQINLTAIPTSPNPYCTARRIYMTTAGSDPNTFANYKLVTTINDNSTTTYTINVADGSLGAALDTSTWGNGNTGEGLNLFGGAAGGADRAIAYAVTIGNCGHIGIAHAIQGGYVGTVFSDSMKIAYCTVQNTYTAAFSMAWTTNLLVEACDFLDSGANNVTEPRWVQSVQGLIVQGDDTIVRYSRIRGSYGQSLFLQGNALGGPQHCRRAQVVHNSIEGNLGLGLIINPRSTGNVADNLVANNIFWNNCLGGMTSQWEGQGYYSGKVYDIFIYWAFVDASLLSLWWDGSAPTATMNGNVIANNIFSTSPEAICAVGGFGQGGTTTYTYAQANAVWPTPFPIAPSSSANFYGDPLFTSTTPGNPSFYAIPSNSPAKDVGRILTGYGYRGSKPDLGVYEV